MCRFRHVIAMRQRRMRGDEKVAVVVVEIIGPSIGGSLVVGAAGEGGDEIVTGHLLHRAAVRQEMKMQYPPIA